MYCTRNKCVFFKFRNSFHNFFFCAYAEGYKLLNSIVFFVKRGDQKSERLNYLPIKSIHSFVVLIFFFIEPEVFILCTDIFLYYVQRVYSSFVENLKWWNSSCFYMRIRLKKVPMSFQLLIICRTMSPK